MRFMRAFIGGSGEDAENEVLVQRLPLLRKHLYSYLAQVIKHHEQTEDEKAADSLGEKPSLGQLWWERLR